MEQYEDDETEYVFIRNNEDYLRYSSCIFYELIGGGFVRVMLFERQRMYDTKVEYTTHIPGSEEGAHEWALRICGSKGDARTDIRKSETDCIMEEYLLDSVHLPIGCTDETTPPGRYWMFKDEVGVTDPCPPLVERMGVQNWILIGGHRGLKQRFTGDLREAMERYHQLQMVEAQTIIDDVFNRTLVGENDILEDISRSTVSCRLVAEGYPDLVFLFCNDLLEIYDGNKLIYTISSFKIDHFVQSIGMEDIIRC